MRASNQETVEFNRLHGNIQARGGRIDVTHQQHETGMKAYSLILRSTVCPPAVIVERTRHGGERSVSSVILNGDEMTATYTNGAGPTDTLNEYHDVQSVLDSVAHTAQLAYL